jgi:hypothetical protein
MATNDQAQQWSANFTQHLQALIDEIVNTKISELCASGEANNTFNSSSNCVAANLMTSLKVQ